MLNFVHAVRLTWFAEQAIVSLATIRHKIQISKEFISMQTPHLGFVLNIARMHPHIIIIPDVVF